MISGLSPRPGQSQLKNINPRNQHSITFADDYESFHNLPDSSYQTPRSPKSNRVMSPNHTFQNPENKFMTFSSQSWLQNKNPQQQSINLGQLTKRLEKISQTIFSSEYGLSFISNSSYSEWIAQMKHHNSIDKLLHSYTQIIFSLIRNEEQQRLESKQKFKSIYLNKTQRTKLKLILNQDQENQINMFKSKGLQGYVKKMQDQSQRYKRQHIRIKQRNRILQNQLLKLALDFKNKRELYLSEITRLTQILHSSFMEVGKMFVNVSNPSNLNYPQESTKYDHRGRNKTPMPIQTTSYNRKNVKSVSPTKRYDGRQYANQQPKQSQFMKSPVKSISNYESHLKPQSVNAKKNNEAYADQKKVRIPMEAQSESEVLQKERSQIKAPPSLRLSASNFSRTYEVQ